MSYRSSSPAHVHTRVDVSLLSVSDRACLRLLEYARVCTASQLATLVYPSLRTALRRTRKLALQNLVTRESLPAERGGIPLAYRLSSSGRRRVHLNAYRSPGLITTRHSLDGVEFVASLVRHDPGLVQLWWPEWLIPGYDWGVNPDHLVVIDTGEASAFILVEVDESTERPPVIRDRLRSYAKLFEDHRIGWHLLWVANSRERLARLRQIAGSMKDAMLSGRCWGVAIGDVSDRGADAEVLAIGTKDPPRPLRGLATDPKARRSEYIVGSAAWISLLANGGKEEIGPVWHGAERNQAHQGESVSEAVKAHLSASTPVAELREWEQLIQDVHTNVDRLHQAGDELAERTKWSDLIALVEALCTSPNPGRQIVAIRLVVRHHSSADSSFLVRLRPCLIGLTAHGHQPSVIQVAREALGSLGDPEN